MKGTCLFIVVFPIPDCSILTFRTFVHDPCVTDVTWTAIGIALRGLPSSRTVRQTQGRAARSSKLHNVVKNRPGNTTRTNSAANSPACPLYPESGHVRCKPSCLLWATSRHMRCTSSCLLWAINVRFASRRTAAKFASLFDEAGGGVRDMTEIDRTGEHP